MSALLREVAFDIPMRTQFRRSTRRAGVLLQGEAGWGEFSPFDDYSTEVTGRWYLAAYEAAALGWPQPLRMQIPVNGIVPAVGPQEAHRITVESGCTTIKVKVAEPGQTAQEDEARVEAVRAALGPSGRIRIDANGAWDLDTAQKMLKVLDRYDLEYAEQPVARLKDMALLRLRTNVPLAADESVRTAEDPMRIAGLDAADIVVLKVQPLGGVRRCLEIAEACGLPVVVSSAVETSVGLAAGVALAAALPELRYACGLGTGWLLEGDVVDEPLRPRNGLLHVTMPVVSQAALQRWTPSEEETQRLMQRLNDAREVAG